MCKTDPTLLDVIKGKSGSKAPVWLMRQAGRYLPEYRELRAKADDFLSFCLSPDLATQATLQPIRRFPLDAAILFADILLVPYALGQNVVFKEKEGPNLEPLLSREDLNGLVWDIDRLSPVFETLRRVKQELPTTTNLIGFAGSPWTVACYMIDGRGGGGFLAAQGMARSGELLLDFLIDSLVNVTQEYILRQIEAGAQIIQLFESHAGLLQGESFERLVIEPTQRIVRFIKEKYPDVPVIGFPRGAEKEDYISFSKKAGIDVVGLDQQIDVVWAKQTLCGKVLQGNLDPNLLVIGGGPMKEAARKILTCWEGKNIFNLAHGVRPDTPPEHVAELVRYVHSYRSEKS